MSYTYRTTFCGGETAGSVANKPNPTVYPDESPKVTSKVNFKGLEHDYFEYSNKKTEDKVSPFTVIAGLAAVTGLVIGGLGYAHKANLLGKLKDGKIKDWLSKLEPAGKKCHEWCSTAKAKGSEGLDWVKEKLHID